MSQRITAKRRKLKRIKKRKRKADSQINYLQTDAYQEDCRKSFNKLIKGFKNERTHCWLCGKEIINGKCDSCTETLCSPFKSEDF